MTDCMKQFLEEASKDKDLIEKLNNAETSEEVIALAAETGFTLTEEDLKPDAGIQDVSDDELDAVAGGKACYCAVGGGGEADSNEKVCACVLVGAGEMADGKDRCACCVGGVGEDKALKPNPYPHPLI